MGVAVTTVEGMAVSETGHLASEAVDGLYRRHGTEVYRYAFAVLGNHADAEDVTQTTFLNAYRSLEQGVQPRKPSNWLLAIASNAIKQRFRQDQARPRYVELDERTVSTEAAEDEGPSVGELLAALSKIPPQQRQAIVLREFEGRSYAEIAAILGVTTSALETLLFRARRSLAEELEHQLTCTEAQLSISRAVDDRIGRKERRRLREHIAECPDCARFASVQKRHRRALKGLMLLPVPLSLSFAKGIEGTAAAATLPAAAAATSAAGIGVGAATATGGGAIAGSVALKAAAVVTAATVATGVGVTGSSEDGVPPAGKKPTVVEARGERIGQVAPRGVVVPGNGVARGKADAPGQSTKADASRGKARTAGGPSSANESAKRASAHERASVRGKSGAAKADAPGQARADGAVTGKSRATPIPDAEKKPTGQKRAEPPARSSSSKQPTVSEDQAGKSKNGPKAP